MSPEEIKSIVMEALRSGVNYIDTSPWYGQGGSEKALGIALEGIPRKAYFIATKLGLYRPDPIHEMCDYSSRKVEESIETSLQNLR